MNYFLKNSFALAAAAIVLANTSSKAQFTAAGSVSSGYPPMTGQEQAAYIAQRNAPRISIEELSALLEKVPATLDNAPGFIVCPHTKTAFATIEVPDTKAKIGIKFDVIGNFNNPTLFAAKIYNLDNRRSYESFKNTLGVNLNLNQAKHDYPAPFSTQARLHVLPVNQGSVINPRLLNGFWLAADGNLAAYKNAQLFDVNTGATTAATAQAVTQPAASGIQAEAPIVATSTNSAAAHPSLSSQTTPSSTAASTNAALPKIDLGAINIAAQKVGVGTVFEKQNIAFAEAFLPESRQVIGYMYRLEGTNATTVGIFNMMREDSRNSYFGTVKAISILNQMGGGKSTSATNQTYHIIPQPTLAPNCVVRGFEIIQGVVTKADISAARAEKVDVKDPATNSVPINVPPTNPVPPKSGPSALKALPTLAS